MYSLKRMCDKLAGLGSKGMLLTLALVVAIAGTAGGTAALLHGARQVTNTFTYGDIVIALEETDTELDEDDDPNTNLYEMEPGKTIQKDPFVTVKANSMNCWLYLQIDESVNFADFMTYAVADGWLPVEGETNIFFRAVDSSAEDQLFPVLLNDQVDVKDTVTLNMLASLTDADYPTLTFTACAVQRDSSITETADPVSAWTLLTTGLDPVQ